MRLEVVNDIFKVLKNKNKTKQKKKTKKKKTRSTNNSISRKTILWNKRKIIPFPDKEMASEESCC